MLALHEDFDPGQVTDPDHVTFELLGELDPADTHPADTDHADTGSGSPDAAVDRLLAAALAAGGADNVSIVVVRADYHETVSEFSEPDEQTRERGLSALSPELDDTRPRV